MELTVTRDSLVDQICDFEHSSSIGKRLYFPCDYVNSRYIWIYSSVFFLSYDTLADFIKTIYDVVDFGKIVVLARSP